MADRDDIPESPDDKIVKEAKKRFRRCEEWESNARKLFLDDLKFANADADNGYQWPNDVRRNRDVDERPCLTINKTRQHNLQIINDARQNKPAAKVRPVGDGATYESAQVYEGIIRHIEYISNAQAAYDTATRFQVQGGIGYWRVVTDYAGDDTFDQEIFIRRIKDPLSVYLDPDIHEVDGSDARFGFIFDDMAKEEFEAAYPRFKDKAAATALGNGDGWIDKEHVRVAEYYRRIESKDRLVAMIDSDTGEQIVVRESKVPREILNLVTDDPQTKFREIVENQIEWFLIVGDEIAERRVLKDRYIPIVRVVAEETIIDGELDRKGHTRAMKDPQRMYNYWSSSAVEHVALQGKTPYVGPMEAFSGLETYWDSANRVNHAWLPYNGLDDQGRQLQKPERAQPPVMAPAYISGMQVARQELMEVSGQYQAEMGAPSNEKSGRAIQERQRQGDTATYHYIDHLAIAIRFTGKILIDLIPKIYDTPRILRIMAEDGSEDEVNLDPSAQMAYFEKRQAQGNAVRRIFNPNVGKYDVEADVGPAYGTRRQEAFNAISQIAAQNPEVMHIAGDLMFKAADFPMADILAERFKRMLPPQVSGEGPPPAVIQMQGQLQNMQKLLGEMAQQLAEEKLKVKAKDQQKDIDVYEAITSRLKVLLPTIVNPADIARMVHDLAKQEHASQLGMVEAASARDLEMDANGQPLVPGPAEQGAQAQ